MHQIYSPHYALDVALASAAQLWHCAKWAASKLVSCQTIQIFANLAWKLLLLQPSPNDFKIFFPSEWWITGVLVAGIRRGTSEI